MEFQGDNVWMPKHNHPDGLVWCRGDPNELELSERLDALSPGTDCPRARVARPVRVGALTIDLNHSLSAVESEQFDIDAFAVELAHDSFLANKMED
jgi:hypothetical protein